MRASEFWGNSGEFWGNSEEFWGNSGEFLQILGKFRGIPGKSDQKLFTSFHSFSQVRNTFPSWGNRIPLISPVATVKIPGEKSEREFAGKKEIRFPFHFISSSTPDQFQLHSTVGIDL